MIDTYRAQRRIVATGFGVLAANGFGKDAFWQSLIDGISGIETVTLFDASGLRSRIAGEVKPCDLSEYIPKKFHPSRMARASRFAVTTAKLAMDDAALTATDFNQENEPALICIGVSTSAMDKLETQIVRVDKKGGKSALPYTAMESLPQAVASKVAAVLGLQAETITLSTGCPAGLASVHQAAQLIKSGKYDLALAGGSDAAVTISTMATFSSARALSERNDEPAKASRPFDLNRDGGIMAEGSAMFVLEDLDHALNRGATPLLEILGYGSMNDKPTGTPGNGLDRSMKMAVDNSGLSPDQIEYICAHGPSDKELDLEEIRAIRSYFGEHANQLRISSIKGVTGNPLAGAGPMQMGCCALAMQHHVVPPTTNFENPEPGYALEGISGQALYGPLTHALINIHGYGGVNSSLVVKKYQL